MNTAPDSRPVRRLPPHVVVAFCGKSGSGKTTLAHAVANVLQADGHLYPYLCSLARPIKLAMHPIDKSDPRFRQVAQQVGDLCRSINPDCFVELLRQRIEAHATPCVALLDDCRRVNEGQIADLVFRLITKRDNGLPVEQRTHISETEWMDMYATETYITDNPDEIGPLARHICDKILAFWRESEDS